MTYTHTQVTAAPNLLLVVCSSLGTLRVRHCNTDDDSKNDCDNGADDEPHLCV